MDESIARLIRGRRELMKLDSSDVAQMAGLSWYEYCDVETHADEFCTVVQLHHARRLCTILNLDLAAITRRWTPQIPAAAFAEGISFMPRNQLIAEKRRALGLTRSDLAGRLGFEEAVGDQLEEEPEYLEEWSLDLVAKVACLLEIPVEPLLAADRCR